MQRVIVLDTFPLSSVAKREPDPRVTSTQLDLCQQWIKDCIQAGNQVVAPAISYYETLRELERLGALSQIVCLRAFCHAVPNRYLHLTDTDIDLAAQLWGQARNADTPTAGAEALDGDVILAAQALNLNLSPSEFIVVTTNVRHLSQFVPADLWTNIRPLSAISRNSAFRLPRRQSGPRRRKAPLNTAEQGIIALMTIRILLFAGLLGAAMGLTGRSAAQTLLCDVSWVGNSYSGKDAWVLQDIEDLCVLPDGTLFTNVGWDEAGGNVQEYKNGVWKGVAGHTHGWGYDGGAAVAANAKYLFIAQNVDSEGGGLKGDSWPQKGYTWAGVSRRPRADIRQAAPFEGGRGKEGDVLQGTFLPVAEVPDGTPGALRGLCADAAHLFVSSPFDNVVKVYDAETMRPLRSWPVARPDKICLDAKGALWVLQRPASSGGAWRAQHFRADGKALPQAIDFPTSVLPTDLCVDGKNRLLVSDAGGDEQIKMYGALDAKPRLVGTLGVKGGIFAAPAGQFGERRFNRPTGVGTDAAGNVYVASDGTTGGGGTVLECYAPGGMLRWRRIGLLFVDLPDADPHGDATDVFTKEEHFTLDGPGGGTYRGYTVNPQKYPDDPRLHWSACTAWVRILNGQRFLFATEMTAEHLQVYRFAPGTETAIPCALFAKRHGDDKTHYPPHQPDKGEWLWTDRNGDGAMQADEYQTNGGADSDGILIPDAQGTIWQANGGAIRALPFGGLNAHGVPQWDYAKARTYPKPPELDQVRRLRYLPGSDVMLLGGNKGEDHNQHWKPMGPVLCLYDHWSGGKPTLRRSVVLPYEKGSGGNESTEPISFDVAGDFVFVAYTRGLKAEGLKNAFVKVLRVSDLSVVGNLSAEAVLGETGLLDLVESVRALRRADGQYLIFLEDDYKAKSIVFRWRPPTP